MAETSAATEPAETTPTRPARQAGGVQSVDRAIELLELLADFGGESGLSELAESAGLPLPTIHRLLRTLLAQGYGRQTPPRRYPLGPRLIRRRRAAADDPPAAADAARPGVRAPDAVAALHARPAPHRARRVRRPPARRRCPPLPRAARARPRRVGEPRDDRPRHGGLRRPGLV